MIPEFKPVWNARLGAQELYGAYRKSELQVDEFEGPRYKRIDHIKKLLNEGLLDQTLRWTKVEA